MIKNYNEKEVTTNTGLKILVAGPLDPQVIKETGFHEQLTAFRRSEQQKEALIEIAELPEGRIVAAIHDNKIIGYVTFHYPDPFERWAEIEMDDLVELGAIEIAKDYRQFGLARELIQLSFADEEMDKLIVLTTEYYWHWDLKGSDLSVWDYRNIMERVMSYGGMEIYATDDPEICSHPANLLMARIGPLVPQESIEKFDNMRFKHRKIF